MPAQDKDFRAFLSSRFVLELGDGGNGKPVGLVNSVDGGNFKSEAVGEKVGVEPVETRYPGRMKFDDIVIQVGTAMAPEFWKWIKDSLNGYNYTRKSGAIVTYDFDGRERARRSFYDAIIAEVQFPALDAKAKAPAFITVKIAVEDMDYDGYGGKAGGGKQPPAPHEKQKLWVPSNFRFSIDGFAEQMKLVTKVESFTVKQNVILNPIGAEKYVRKEAGRVEYPTISFSLPENHAEPFCDWWDKFVSDMQNERPQEKTGVIEYMDSSLTQVLTTIHLYGLGITGVTFEKHDANSDAIRMCKVDLYCEELTVSAPGGKATHGTVS